MSALQNTKPMKVCEGCGELFRPSPEEPRATCCNDECKGLKRIQNQRGSETRKVLEGYYRAVLEGTMSMAEASRRLYPVLRDHQRLKWRPKNPDGLLEGQVAVPEAVPKRAKKAKKSPFYSGSFVESSRFVDSFGEPMPAEIPAYTTIITEHDANVLMDKYLQRNPGLREGLPPPVPGEDPWKWLPETQASLDNESPILTPEQEAALQKSIEGLKAAFKDEDDEDDE